jgi:hypothetical protein
MKVSINNSSLPPNLQLVDGEVYPYDDRQCLVHHLCLLKPLKGATQTLLGDKYRAPFPLELQSSFQP